MTARASRDWKVTTAHRVLIRIGWAGVGLALYFATAAALLDSVGAWWIVVGVAAVALAIGASLPEPVPHDLIVNKIKVDPGGAS